MSLIAAISFILIKMTIGYRTIGLPPVIIVGGSGIAGLVMWYKTYLKRPLEANVILPPFLLTVAALEVHMTEEYLTRFLSRRKGLVILALFEPCRIKVRILY